MKEKRITVIVKYLILLIASIFVLFPFVWTILTSIKPEVQIFAIPTIWFPHPVTLKNYFDVFSTGEFQARLLNSVIISVVSTFISMIVGIPAAYAFARYPYKGSNLAFWLIASLRMLPTVILGVPIFFMMRNIGLLDTRLGLIIIYLPFQLALSIWLLYGGFKKLPYELEQAAFMDGLGIFGTMIRIALPLSVPTIGVAAVFSFLQSWNEFFFAMMTTSSSNAMTLPVYIAGNVTTQRVFWGRMTAMATLYAIPAIVFTLIAQKGLVKGLTAGAIKE